MSDMHPGIGDATPAAIRGRLRKADLALMRRQSLARVVAVALVLWLMLSFVFGFMRCTGETMSPALEDGDLLIYYRLSNTYESGDIVVYTKDNVQYIGRIAAMPADEVEITEDGTLVINGYYQASTDTTPYARQENADYPLNLAEEEYFILLDDRSSVLDSRTFGAVKLDDIDGKLLTLLRRRGF